MNTELRVTIIGCGTESYKTISPFDQISDLMVPEQAPSGPQLLMGCWHQETTVDLE